MLLCWLTLRYFIKLRGVFLLLFFLVRDISDILMYYKWFCSRFGRMNVPPLRTIIHASSYPARCVFFLEVGIHPSNPFEIHSNFLRALKSPPY